MTTTLAQHEIPPPPVRVPWTDPLAPRLVHTNRPVVPPRRPRSPVAVERTKVRGRVASIVPTALLVLFAGVWFVTLRPQGLGGPAGYVMVNGVSMLPTYQGGDLVIVKKHDHYRRGDIVAYRIPEGDVGAGIIVIHRIIGGSAAEGFELLGDNNAESDDWRPKPRDIVGKEWLHVPNLAKLLAFLHAPVPLASIATGIAAAVLLVPSAKRKHFSSRR